MLPVLSSGLREDGPLIRPSLLSPPSLPSRPSRPSPRRHRVVMGAVADALVVLRLVRPLAGAAVHLLAHLLALGLVAIR